MIIFYKINIDKLFKMSNNIQPILKFNRGDDTTKPSCTPVYTSPTINVPNNTCPNPNPNPTKQMQYRRKWF